MKITIIGRKVNLRTSFKELVEKKLSKFERIFDADAEATVTVTVERNRQTVEITIRQRGMICRAEDTSLDMNEALDHVIAALGRQMRRNKTRLEKRIRAEVIEPAPAYDDEPEEEFKIVRNKRFSIQPMSVQEAVLQMNLLEHSFYAFRNADEGDAFAVVYKRKNGDYGLILDAKD